MTTVIGPVPWRSLRPLRALGVPRGRAVSSWAARGRGGALPVRAGPGAARVACGRGGTPASAQRAPTATPPHHLLMSD
eukprot:3936241-Lingulodinium_polyedra.AAC.1